MFVTFATYQSIMLLKGGPYTHIVSLKRSLETLGVQVKLFGSWQEFEREDVDLVHLFGAHIGTYHLARELHKLSVPFVVTPIFFSQHSVWFLRAAVRFGDVVRKAVCGVWTDYGMLRDICSWSRAVLPNTRAEAALLEKGFGIDRKKITVVPNGVDPRFTDADPKPFKERYGVENFILNVGHVGPGRKNILRLIRALEKINTPAVIIGRIEQNEYGRRCLEEARRNPRLMILNQLPNESELLASAYAACDVFVLPSLFETPGIAALEAALAGAKVVISKHGGTDEYFGPYAEYVEPTSVELIRHGIVTALNKPKDSRLCEHVSKRFLWEHVAAKMHSVYEDVLASI